MRLACELLLIPLLAVIVISHDSTFIHKYVHARVLQESGTDSSFAASALSSGSCVAAPSALRVPLICLYSTVRRPKVREVLRRRLGVQGSHHRAFLFVAELCVHE